MAERAASTAALIVLRCVIFTLVGIILVLGFIIFCPFPSFWQDLTKGE